MRYLLMMCLILFSDISGATECPEQRFAKLYNSLPTQLTNKVLNTECRPNIDVREYYGDRFKPVIIRVYNVDEIRLKQTMNTIGWVDIPNDDFVLIYGNGATGYGDIEINGEIVGYEILPEPVCEKYTTGYETYDCEGNLVDRYSDEYIYYGPDDTEVVTWEVGILWYNRDMEMNETEKTPLDSVLIANARKKISDWNEIYANSDIHVRLELKEVYTGRVTDLEILERFGSQWDVDVILGLGYSYSGTCGVAYPNRRFREGYAIGGFSVCDKYTDLHELGHAVGLAHGPENQAYEREGYIFKEFGHGWNDICGDYDTIMSYGRNGIFFSNSELTCFDVISWQTALLEYDFELFAGDRSITDEAHAINRVRYDVSLIHRERDRKPAYKSAWIPLDRPLIID